jgi:hypothetical protein
MILTGKNCTSVDAPVMGRVQLLCNPLYGAFASSSRLTGLTGAFFSSGE